MDIIGLLPETSHFSLFYFPLSGHRQQAIEAYQLVLSHTPEFTKALFNLAALLTRSAPPHPTTNQSKVFPSSTTATSASSATVSTAVSRQVTNANRTELIMAIDIYRRLTHVELASAYERGDVSNALPLDCSSCVVVV